MKIEKVNENQIRCTLTREDLASRHMKLSELAYGTEKAKTLFREMMEQASFQFGFDAEDIPLMIEAVPLTPDTILLIVTKVEYPEELDTRFSRFSEDMDIDDDDYDDILPAVSSAASDIIDLFRKAKETRSPDKESSVPPVSPLEQSQEVIDVTKLFVFSSLDDLIRLSHIVDGFYRGRNVLYKGPGDNKYYLVISKSSHSPEDFNKTCNILTEYGSQNDLSAGQDAYFREHYTVIIPQDAIATLAQL
jgi:adapter protein MecA 1/2